MHKPVELVEAVGMQCGSLAAIAFDSESPLDPFLKISQIFTDS